MGRLLSVVIIILIAIGSFFYWQKDKNLLFSPTAGDIGVSKTQIVNNWFPLPKSSKELNSLGPSAKSAILVNYETGDVIYAKDPTLKLAAASTIKIMTALVALENAKLSDKFIVSEKAAKIGENSMNLAVGEKLTIEELLYGLMLVSGNDAAITIAEGIAGSEEQFVELMNSKVKSLGLFDTKFVNASGLDEDGKDQYSTAYDLSVIAHYLWEQHNEIQKITSTYQKEIAPNSNHKYFNLYNDTNLLTTYPGVYGIKPGFTWNAGLCLVTYAENEGKKLLAVILGSDDRRGEMMELLDYGFAYYGIKIDHPVLNL